MLLFFDGFDGYFPETAAGRASWATMYLSAPGSPAISASPTRYGTGSYMKLNTNEAVVPRVFPRVSNTCIIGAATRYLSVSGYDADGAPIYQVWDTQPGLFTYCHISLEMSAEGVLKLYRGQKQYLNWHSTIGAAQLLATSTKPLIPNRWYYLEMKVVLGASGSVEVRADGETILSFSGDTRNQVALTTTFGFMQLSAYINGSVESDFDDFYVADGQGSVNNDFLGDSTIVAALVGVEGTHLDFTPVGFSDHAQNVSEALADGDTTYNYSNVPGDRDSYKFIPALASALPSGTIRALGVILNYRQTNAGVRTAKTFMRLGGVDYDHADDLGDIPTGYEYRQQIWEQNPATSANWTPTEVGDDTNEIGFKVET